MENSGLFFVGRCGSPTCNFYNTLTTLYIGKGKTFDFVKERRLCMCGGCFSAITDIMHVFFYSCKWSYNGQLLTGETRQSEHEQHSTSVEFFPAEKQELPWKWLKFTIADESVVRRLQSVQATQTQETDLQRSAVYVQTDPEVSLPRPDTRVVNEEVVDSLIKSVKRYREKYHDLKRSQGNKKPKCQ